MTEYKNPNFVSCVVYVHNQEKTIEKFLLDLIEYMKNKFQTYEVIVIDNASWDNSVEQIKKVGKVYSGVITLIELSYFSHHESAMQIGTDASIGDYVFEFDTSDYEFNGEFLDNMFKKTCEGNDVVTAVQNKSGLLSKLSHLVLKLLIKSPFIFETDQIRIVSRRAINAASKITDKTIYRRIKYQIIGYQHAILKSEIKSNSKPFKDRVEMFLDVLFSFSNLSMKVGSTMSLLFMMFSVVIVGYIGFSMYFNQHIASGWISLMGFLSVSLFGVFLMLAIISRYLQMLFREIRTIPNVVVKSITKIS